MEKFNCAYTKIVDINHLQPNPKNPNNHPDRQIELLAKIISYQGQRKAIVVSNRTGFMTKGHGTLMAIQKLGWKTVAVDYQNYESEAQEYADIIADNKIAELAEHDDDKMLQIINETNQQDLELLGLDDFSLPEVEEAEMPDLNDGDKPELEQITFTLHKDQMTEVKNALAKSLEMGEFVNTNNENKNGNAIARICEWFLNGSSQTN